LENCEIEHRARQAGAVAPHCTTHNASQLTKKEDRDQAAPWTSIQAGLGAASWTDLQEGSGDTSHFNQGRRAISNTTTYGHFGSAGNQWRRGIGGGLHRSANSLYTARGDFQSCIMPQTLNVYTRIVVGIAARFAFRFRYLTKAAKRTPPAAKRFSTSGSRESK
jgi:hypothetical protein